MRDYKILSVLMVILVAVGLTGCVTTQKAATQKPVEVACPLPSSKIVSVAFEEAQNTLSRAECASQFDDTFEALLVAAAGDPKKDNKILFHNFLKWTIGEGIIRKTDGARLYTEYFSYKFASLPQDYNICSYESKQEQIKADLLKELVKKERGLIQISKDQASYTIAHNNQAKLNLILEATWRACSDGREF